MKWLHGLNLYNMQIQMSQLSFMRKQFNSLHGTDLLILGQICILLVTKWGSTRPMVLYQFLCISTGAAIWKTLVVFFCCALCSDGLLMIMMGTPFSENHSFSGLQLTEKNSSKHKNIFFVWKWCKLWSLRDLCPMCWVLPGFDECWFYVALQYWLWYILVLTTDYSTTPLLRYSM